MKRLYLKRKRAWWFGGTLAIGGIGFGVAASCVAIPREAEETAQAESPQAAHASALSSLPPECATEAAPQPGNPPQHPDDCHGNPDFVADGTAVMTRGDIAPLPAPLKNQITRIACRPHST